MISFKEWLNINEYSTVYEWGGYQAGPKLQLTKQALDQRKELLGDYSRYQAARTGSPEAKELNFQISMAGDGVGRQAITRFIVKQQGPDPQATQRMNQEAAAISKEIDDYLTDMFDKKFSGNPSGGKFYDSVRPPLKTLAKPKDVTKQGGPVTWMIRKTYLDPESPYNQKYINA